FSRRGYAILVAASLTIQLIRAGGTRVPQLLTRSVARTLLKGLYVFGVHHQAATCDSEGPRQESAPLQQVPWLDWPRSLAENFCALRAVQAGARRARRYRRVRRIQGLRCLYLGQAALSVQT